MRFFFFFFFWRGGLVGKEESVWVFGLCVYWNELVGTEMVDINGLWVVSIAGDMAYERW